MKASAAASAAAEPQRGAGEIAGVSPSSARIAAAASRASASSAGSLVSGGSARRARSLQSASRTRASGVSRSASPELARLHQELRQVDDRLPGRERCRAPARRRAGSRLGSKQVCAVRRARLGRRVRRERALSAGDVLEGVPEGDAGRDEPARASSGESGSTCATVPAASIRSLWRRATAPRLGASGPSAGRSCAAPQPIGRGDDGASASRGLERPRLPPEAARRAAGAGAPPTVTAEERRDLRPRAAGPGHLDDVALRGA